MAKKKNKKSTSKSLMGAQIEEHLAKLDDFYEVLEGGNFVILYTSGVKDLDELIDTLESYFGFDLKYKSHLGDPHMMKLERK